MLAVCGRNAAAVAAACGGAQILPRLVRILSGAAVNYGTAASMFAMLPLCRHGGRPISCTNPIAFNSLVRGLTLLNGPVVMEGYESRQRPVVTQSPDATTPIPDVVGRRRPGRRLPIGQRRLLGFTRTISRSLLRREPRRLSSHVRGISPRSGSGGRQDRGSAP
jgi:hypothetical protein